MILTKISRSKSFEMVNGYGLKSWDKFGLEAELRPNEDPISAYRELDLMIDRAHKDSYKPEPPKEIQVKKETNPTTNMITAITTCTEVATLKTFEKLAKSKPEFQVAYDYTMEKLTNQSKN